MEYISCCMCIIPDYISHWRCIVIEYPSHWRNFLECQLIIVIWRKIIWCKDNGVHSTGVYLSCRVVSRNVTEQATEVPKDTPSRVRTPYRIGRNTLRQERAHSVLRNTKKVRNWVTGNKSRTLHKVFISYFERTNEMFEDWYNRNVTRHTLKTSILLGE